MIFGEVLGNEERINGRRWREGSDVIMMNVLENMWGSKVVMVV